MNYKDQLLHNSLIAWFKYLLFLTINSILPTLVSKFVCSCFLKLCRFMWYVSLGCGVDLLWWWWMSTSVIKNCNVGLKHVTCKTFYSESSTVYVEIVNHVLRCNRFLLYHRLESFYHKGRDIESLCGYYTLACYIRSHLKWMLRFTLL